MDNRGMLGMLGNLIGIIIIVGIAFMSLGVINETMNYIEEDCINVTVNTSNHDLCFIFHETVLIKILWDFFPYFLIIFTFLIVWNIVKSSFRGTSFRGISWERESDDKDDDEKEQYLKETKTKLKKELNRESSQDNQPKNKGVQWGSGVELGKGMDSYENKLKGGDK